MTALRTPSRPGPGVRLAALGLAAALTAGTALLTILLVAAGGQPPSAAVRVYGAAGSFGQLADSGRLPTGQQLSVQSVPGWGFLAGEAAYFAQVTPDGTVLIANEPQTDNQSRPTARQMAVSAFDPGRDRFRNIVIPTSTGARSVTGPPSGPAAAVGGADVSDLAITSAGDTPRIAFLSALPYGGWSIDADGVYPTLGYLARTRDGWSYDARASTTALGIARSATLETGQPCPQETSAGGGAFADCRLPTEIAALPASHDLVVTQYASSSPAGTSGGLMVLSPSGRLLAAYPYPRVALPGGQVVAAHPREVDADPVSPSGDEHFVVVFDSSTGARLGPFVMQEFSFDAQTRTIRPVSAPVLSGERSPAGQPLGFETAQYDRAGDLWAAQSQNGTLIGGPIAVYRRRVGGGTLGGPGCGVSMSSAGAGWGTTCPPDAEIPRAAQLGVARSINQDPRTGAMLVATMAGDLLPIRMTDGGRGLIAGTPVDLGLSRLADRRMFSIDFRKGSVDAATDTLYLPVQQLLSRARCPAYPCAPVRLDQWLMAIRLAPIVGAS